MLIRFYTTVVGASPVQKYLRGLSDAEAAVVNATLKDLAINGLAGSTVALRPIKGKLWEIKAGAHRVFYVVLDGPTMVLLHAYRKQSQKAPKHELETAAERFRGVTGRYP